VITVTTGGETFAYRRKPCEKCPWRVDSEVGAFPAEAYRISANTAYDMSTHTFACHMSGKENPTTCAGFLISGSDHNLSVRMQLMNRRLDLSKVKSDDDLYESYRDMAEANGVDEDDPALRACR